MPEYTSSLGSCGSPLSAIEKGRCVSPMTREKVVGVGYDRRYFVAAHPDIPLAPKTRATLLLDISVVNSVSSGLKINHS